MARLWLHDYDMSALERRSVRPVTSLASSDEDGGPGPSEQYRVPSRATEAGRRAFHEVMRRWAAQLAEQMEIGAQRAGDTDPEFTAIHVHDARRAIERQHSLPSEPDRSDHRVIAAILLTVGTIGVGVLSNFLVGPWQVLVFVVFVVVLLVGLILTWTGRVRKPGGEP